MALVLMMLVLLHLYDWGRPVKTGDCDGRPMIVCQRCIPSRGRTSTSTPNTSISTYTSRHVLILALQKSTCTSFGSFFKNISHPSPPIFFQYFKHSTTLPKINRQESSASIYKNRNSSPSSIPSHQPRHILFWETICSSWYDHWNISSQEIFA